MLALPKLSNYVYKLETCGYFCVYSSLELVLSCSTGTLYIVLLLPKLGKPSNYVYKIHVVTLCGSLEYILSCSTGTLYIVLVPPKLSN